MALMNMTAMGGLRMTRAISFRFVAMALFLVALCADTCRAAGDDLDRVNRDILGAWLVDVETEPRSRVLNVTRAEFVDGAWVLENTYGWTDGGQSPIAAKLIVKPDGYALLLTTQANSRIAADFAGANLFEGTFEWSNGKKVRKVRIERLSGKELASRAARLSEERMQAQINAPDSSVSADCARWLGGWEGKWTTRGYTDDISFWVTRVTQSGDTCNLVIKARQGIGSPPKPLAATDRTTAEYLCNSGTGGNCRMRISADGSAIDINYRNIDGGTNYAPLRRIGPQ